MKSTFRSLKKQKGQSMVELGLTLSVLVLLACGVLDLGRVFYAYLSLFDAAQEGAMYASMYPSLCGSVYNRVKGSIQDVFSTVDIYVYVNGSPVSACQNVIPIKEDHTVLDTACLGQEIKVVVEQPKFAMITPIIGAIWPTVSLKAQASDIVLRPRCP